MVWVVGIAVIAVIWLFMATGKAKQRTDYLIEISESMSEQDLHEQFDKYYFIALDQMSDPMHSQFTSKQSDEAIERLVVYQERLNQIHDLEHGPAWRVKARFQLLKQLRDQTK
ncbi:hypothetical protein [Pseudovibrio sp. Tun.PSC04-5.I4]|uniref:hypothetical protein n=1 Tax=Pseudovibrio sp. Tun.PSC04-5.I4 TaxID=1798213 RepID=UPI00088CC309|nr:hypothetical protein [Pseudovibrio sp. Tun.PSC04-5.I4]SDR23008.1 hypothetical protein SAMN04515695_3594 [Pseudovibrio sp. Tun.PSC04-5.I4]